VGDLELKREASMKYLALFIVGLLFFASCGDGNHVYAPKPRGFYRIEFPKKEYQEYTADCPYTFTYPKYAIIEPDKKAGAKPCWVNMQFPQFKATLHLSYQPVTSKKEFNELVEDARTFAFKHTVKATSIDEGVIHYADKKVYGIYYTIDGNAASSAQFFLTDSTRNYIRGALYFNSEPRLDSIQPVLNFIKQDVAVMIKSFKWK
jgi:gliding motility-associated lipoprotein GldD